MKYNFAGWSTDVIGNWEDKFDELYNDDGSLILVSKEIYKHDEPEADLCFEYRFVIECTDVYSRCGEDDANYIVVALYLVPETKYWADNVIMEAASMCGWENEPKEKLLEMLNAQDAISAGCAVSFDSDSVHYSLTEHDEGFYDVLDNEEVVEKLNTVASMIDPMNSFRGFALDKPWNLLGCTGWDTLDYALHGTDQFKTAMDRFKNSQQ